MRNRWGVEIKKGHWVSGRGSRGDAVQGRVAKIERTGEYARAYGPRVILDTGESLGVDDIAQTLGPMTVEDDGTVRQNPGYTLPRGRDRWYVYGINGERIADDLFYKTALGALKKVFPGVHVYSSGVSGAGTVSYAIDKEPRHVFVSPDPDFDLRRKNPLTRVRIKSPPQRPAGNSSAPSKRLVNRRKKTAKAAPGVYANPAPGYLYCVWRLDANGKPAYFMRAERSLKLAKEYASALADKAGTPYGIIKKPL